MGWFSGSSWQDEYDARLEDPGVKKDVMRNFGLFKPREVRVADDAGVMRRRNGDGCCGCGRWSDHHGNVPDEHTPTGKEPVVTDHHSRDDDEPRRLFLGIF